MTTTGSKWVSFTGCCLCGQLWIGMVRLPYTRSGPIVQYDVHKVRCPGCHSHVLEYEIAFHLPSGASIHFY